MSESKTSADQAEKLAQRLQQSLAQRRPRPWKTVLLTLLIGGILVALLVWYFYPQRREVLQVVAFDAVFTSEQSPQASAQLLLPSEEESPRRLRGQTVVFQEIWPRPGEKLREISQKSDDEGRAMISWTAAEFQVRYVNVQDRQQSLRDTGRIFIWPKEKAILLVDADALLSVEPLDEKVQATLQEKAKTFNIAYLSLASPQPVPFQQARDRIQALQNQQQLPAGPVLGRQSYPSKQTAAQAWHSQIAALQQQFRGPLTAMGKTADTVQVCKELGVPVIQP